LDIKNIKQQRKKIMSQPYSFSFYDSLLAEIAGVTTKSMHFDVDSILKAFDGARPLAKELGVEPPSPRLYGFGYPHVAALGAHIEFPEDSEPNVSPIIHSPEDIDRLKEPADYLAAPLIQTRLKIAAELGKRRKDAGSKFIGHPYEGPVTTAVLLMGQDFFTLVYDDPKRAHKLLKFCTETALHYVGALHRHFYGNTPRTPGGNPDDFAGMLPPSLFDEFVVPYWNMLYEGQGAATRYLHSELLREDHLPYLRKAKIDYYDPGADQYLTPELLSRKCPCPFQNLIKSWEINGMTADQLEKFYREIAACKPFHIRFSMDRMDQLDKVKRLLKVARELEK
jgi:hypothetical protein